MVPLVWGGGGAGGCGGAPPPPLVWNHSKDALPPPTHTSGEHRGTTNSGASGAWTSPGASLHPGTIFFLPSPPPLFVVNGTRGWYSPDLCTPPPLSLCNSYAKVRQSRRRPSSTREDCTVSWCKKGEYTAQISPKSELCGFKWANTHNRCVHDPMQLANVSPNPCLVWPHYISYRIKLGTQLIRTLRPLWLGQGRSLYKGGGVC